jgi:hypothetical protein
MDLTWIGSTNNTAYDDDPSNYSCEFCNVALIHKRDDINDSNYGPDKMRRICPSCLQIKDPNYGNEELKHRETFRPLTDGPKPYAECLGNMYSNNNNNNELERDDDDDNDELDEIEPHEIENLQKLGCAKITTITRSSVTGHA